MTNLEYVQEHNTISASIEYLESRLRQAKANGEDKEVILHIQEEIQEGYELLTQLNADYIDEVIYESQVTIH